MKTNKNKILTALCMLCLSFVLITGTSTAKAATTTSDIPYNANGLFFGTDVYHYDVRDMGTSIDFYGDNSKRVYLPKLRMSSIDEYQDEEYKNKTIKSYPEDYLYLWSKDYNNFQITGVKSSKSGLKCMINTETVYTYKDGTPTSYYYPSSAIKVKAFKPGTYTVTVSVRLANGKTDKLKATVFVPKKSDLELTTPNAKFGQNGTYKNSSLKVKLKPGNKIGGLKLYYQNTDPTAELLTEARNGRSYTTQVTRNKWIKIKNGGKIKLKSNTSYKLVWNQVENQDFMTYTNITTKAYSTFFPATTLRVVYKDSFYNVTRIQDYTLEKHKKY